MLISRKNRFVFIHVPKTGGTSMEDVLHPFAEPGDWSESVNAKHFSAVGIRRRYFTPEEWERFYSFAIVRNPWDRLASMYHYSRMMGEQLANADMDKIPKWKHVWVKKALREHKRNLSWHEWLWEMCREGRGASQFRFIADKHWKPNPEQRVIVSHVGKFEDLDAEFATICAGIGLPQMKLPHLNASHSPPYQEQYTDYQKDLVLERFRPEIEFFGYEF